MERKVICTERRCNWRGTEKEVLTAPSPFDADDTINGCPKCKAIGTIVYACDEQGCWRETSSGTPTPTGYRSTCFEHRPKEKP